MNSYEFLAEYVAAEPVVKVLSPKQLQQRRDAARSKRARRIGAAVAVGAAAGLASRTRIGSQRYAAGGGAVAQRVTTVDVGRHFGVTHSRTPGRANVPGMSNVPKMGDIGVKVGGPKRYVSYGGSRSNDGQRKGSSRSVYAEFGGRSAEIGMKRGHGHIGPNHGGTRISAKVSGPKIGERVRSFDRWPRPRRRIFGPRP